MESTTVAYLAFPHRRLDFPGLCEGTVRYGIASFVIVLLRLARRGKDLKFLYV